MVKQQIISHNERIAAAIAKANNETESLIAKYLAANPEASIENSTLIQQRLPDGSIRLWVEPIGRLAAFNAMEAALLAAKAGKLSAETRQLVEDALALVPAGR